MVSTQYPLTGSGLGLRRSFIKDVASQLPPEIDFMEVAPENWIDVGGLYGELFNQCVQQTTMVCHGLSLNLGGSMPLDEAFLIKVRSFIKKHKVACYSEHLSYCADDGHLYDLMPIPFTEEAVHYVSQRIQHVQDVIGQRMAIENISYYAAPSQVLSEIDFINAVLEEADCYLLLDINNIYVNSINHQYDPEAYLRALPEERIAYAHIAGHYEEEVDLRVDTHAANVIEPVWDLLKTAYDYFGVFPTLLERDFNIPEVPTLIQEVIKIKSIQSQFDSYHHSNLLQQPM